MNDQSGVKSSEGKKTKQTGVSARYLQGEDQTIKFQEDVIATVLNALKENEKKTEECRVDDIGQGQRKNKRKRSNILDASSRDPDSDSSDSDTNAGTCIHHLMFMVFFPLKQYVVIFKILFCCKNVPIK